MDGKAKTKGKERRVFLFEKVIIFSELITRDGGLPAYRYVHNLKVVLNCIHYNDRLFNVTKFGIYAGRFLQGWRVIDSDPGR